MAIESHRNRIALHLFLPKKSYLHIASIPTKNRICYRISKLNKNNLRLERKVWVWVWSITSQCIN